MLWVTRLAWIVVGVTGWTMIDDLGLGGGSVVAVASLATLGWVLGVGGLSIPATPTLTLARVTVPIAIPALGAVAIVGDDISTDATVGAVIAAVSATVIVLQPGFGRLYVQASAYGREDRHLLRTPPSYLLAAIVAWLVTVTAGVGAAIAFGGETWWLGGLLTALATAAAAFSWPRWYRLSRRWLVLLPSGVVIHDHLVLAETLMIPKADVAGLRLAPADTEAADLTGPAGGHAVEVLTRDAVTAIRAATPARPHGSALHLRACLVAPTRPGQALAAAQAYRLPVG